MSWLSLPKDFRKNVVKKLDLMSRYAMKSVSKKDREMVNSIKMRIPRVRFGFAEGKCLLMIYTGIEKFLRMELSECKGGTIIHRSENSWEPNEISTKLIPSSNPFDQGILILQSLLANRSIIIEVMELESENLDFFEKFSLKMRNRLRIRKIVSMEDNAIPFSKTLLDRICFLDEVEMIESIHISPSVENLYPMASYIALLSCDDMPLVITRYFMEHNEREWGILNGRCQEHMSTVRKGISLSTHSRIKINPDQKWDYDREEKSGVVTRTTKTKCGEWVHMVRSENERKRMAFFMSETCGLGGLCQTCADPFNYWYIQNLPRRLIQEPFWIDVFKKQPTHKLIEIATLKIRLENDEKQKEKGQKKKKKEGVASWGFRHVSVEKLMSNRVRNQEKKNKKRMVKMRRKGVVVEDVRTLEKVVKAPEVIEKAPELPEAVLKQEEGPKNPEDALQTSEDLAKPPDGPKDQKDTLKTPKIKIEDPEAPKTPESITPTPEDPKPIILDPAESALMLLIETGAFKELSEQSKQSLTASLPPEAKERISKVMKDHGLTPDVLEQVKPCLAGPKPGLAGPNRFFKPIGPFGTISSPLEPPIADLNLSEPFWAKPNRSKTSQEEYYSFPDIDKLLAPVIVIKKPIGPMETLFNYLVQAFVPVLLMAIGFSQFFLV